MGVSSARAASPRRARPCTPSIGIRVNNITNRDRVAPGIAPLAVAAGHGEEAMASTGYGDEATASGGLLRPAIGMRLQADVAIVVGCG